MPLNRLDHVNLRTANLQALQDFYIEVLGMTLGARPPFAFGGAWLYSGPPGTEKLPTVHLVEVPDQPAPKGELRLEHFAFAAEGLGDFLATLKRHGVSYRIGVVPGFEIIQVNVNDPDGNHIHVDFAPAEAAQAPEEPALEKLLSTA
jgi:catechol 2,3-dioxygenase-like lactoylglutathione lyase family enzyme